MQGLELNDDSENMFLNQHASEDNAILEPENHENNHKVIKVEGSDGKHNGIPV